MRDILGRGAESKRGIGEGELSRSCVCDKCLISVLPMRGAQTKWMFLCSPHSLRTQLYPVFTGACELVDVNGN